MPEPLEAVIGLEVHLQLRTRTKMFSACRADYFSAEPNSFTDPLTLGLPGALPVINRQAVELAILFGLALGCQLEGRAQFHRKNYFYPDSPKNYQISQYDSPIGRSGHLDLGGRTVRVRRIHLEDDAGKLIHPPGEPVSLLDLNRAGMPLIELVTEPDLTSPLEARDFLYQLRSLAQTLGVSDANPEEGKMRADVNLSLRAPGAPLGTKVEIKNLNSFRSVQRALEYQTEVQRRQLRSGEAVRQATFGWDEAAGRTYLLRSKEQEADYRYFPEPDLPPLAITKPWIEKIRARLPELPSAKEARYLALGVRAAEAALLSQSPDLSSFLDRAIAAYPGPAQTLVNWLLGDVAGTLTASGIEIAASPLRPEHLAALVDRGEISGKMAKELLPEVMEGGDPQELVAARGLRAVRDETTLTEAIEATLREQRELAERVISGSNPKAIHALFGQVMRRTGGAAQPERLRDLLRARLERLAAERAERP